MGEVNIMITEDYVESLYLPDYDAWAEHIWCDGYWWDWILDEFVEDCDKIGISIDYDKGHSGRRTHPQIYFDLYHNDCSSNGRVTEGEKFYEAYKERLLAESAVLAQMVAEDWIYIKWGVKGRNNYLCNAIEFPDDYAVDGELFEKGLFAGTSVPELYELETHRIVGIENVISAIIEEIHNDLYEKLQSAYEHDTSEETYKEWILMQIMES